MIKNRKALAPLGIALVIGLSMMAIYLFLFLPFPKLAHARVTINYILSVLLTGLIPVLFFYGYYRLAKSGFTGYKLIKNKLFNLNFKVKNFLLHHK